MSKETRLFLTRTLSLLPCIIIVRYSNIEDANILLNILQFVQVPFVLIPTLKFASNLDIMGRRWVLKDRKLKIILALTSVMILMNIIQLVDNIPATLMGRAIGYPLIIGYLISLYWLYKKEIKAFEIQNRMLELIVFERTKPVSH